MLKIGAILVVPWVLFALLVGATGVVTVEIEENGPDGVIVEFPVPLILAQAALSFAPDEAKYVECAELAKYHELAERVVRELRDVEDFTMLEVEEDDEQVIVRKEGDALVVDVFEDDEEVHCRVPLRSAARILHAYDGRGFRTRSMVGALRSAPRGDIVRIRDAEDMVRIRKL